MIFDFGLKRVFFVNKLLYISLFVNKRPKGPKLISTKTRTRFVVHRTRDSRGRKRQRVTRTRHVPSKVSFTRECTLNTLYFYSPNEGGGAGIVLENKVRPRVVHTRIVIGVYRDGSRKRKSRFRNRIRNAGRQHVPEAQSWRARAEPTIHPARRTIHADRYAFYTLSGQATDGRTHTRTLEAARIRRRPISEFGRNALECVFGRKPRFTAVRLLTPGVHGRPAARTRSSYRRLHNIRRPGHVKGHRREKKKKIEKKPHSTGARTCCARRRRRIHTHKGVSPYTRRRRRPSPLLSEKHDNNTL